MRELVRPDESGLLFTAGDSEALAIRMRELLTDEERAHRLGVGARERALGNYDWPACVAGYETLYRRLANGEPVPG